MFLAMKKAPKLNGCQANFAVVQLVKKSNSGPIFGRLHFFLKHHSIATSFFLNPNLLLSSLDVTMTRYGDNCRVKCDTKLPGYFFRK